MVENIKVDEYIKVQKSVVKKTGLKANSLLIYSLIYGFNTSTEKPFRGSLAYIAESINSDRCAVCKLVNKLVAEGFLSKTEIFDNGVKYCTYVAVLDGEKIIADEDEGIVKNTTPLSNEQQGVVKETTEGVVKRTTNNLNLDNTNNIRESSTHSDNSTDNQKSHEQSECGRREKENVANATCGQKKERAVPTLDEAREYFTESGFKSSPDKFFYHYEAKGWERIRNWKAQAKLWELRERDCNPTPKAEEHIRKVNPCQDYYDYINSQNRSN